MTWRLRFVGLAVILIACLATGFPAPSEAADAATQPIDREQLIQQRHELATELAATIQKIDALPSDAAKDVRADLSREVELLKRIDLTLGQRLSAIDRINELLATGGQLAERVEGLRLPDGAGQPAPSLIVLESLRDELESERARTATVQTALQAASEAAADARKVLSEKQAVYRRAKESLDTSTDETAKAALTRARRIAQVDSRLASATLELREAQLQHEALNHNILKLRITSLEQHIESAKQSFQFTRKDLQLQLLDIETRRARIRERLELQEGHATYLEEQWYGAKRRLDTSPDTDPDLVEEIQARKLAFQARKEEIDALKQKLGRLEDAEVVWNRRFEIARRGIERATLRTWAQETQSHIDGLRTEYHLQSARASDIRAQLANLGTTMESADVAKGQARQWLKNQQTHLRSMADTLDERLADIETSRRLYGRLLADIGLDVEHRSWGEFFSDVWASVIAVWRFEITSVDERPITVGKIVVGVFILLVGLLVSRFLSRFLGRRILVRFRIHEGVVAAIQAILFYLLVITFALFAFRAVNIPLTAFTVLGGALAIGVGFGSQNIINNFISGLILLAERPIRVGDLIQIDDLFGSVEHIGARSTRVRTGENVEIIVPNSSFLERNVINWTLSEDRVRVVVSVGVAYGSPTREVAKLLQRAAEEHGRVLKSPAPFVIFTDFGDNSLNFQVYFWIRMRTMTDRRMIESDVRHRIDGLFREAGIVIAFPQRDVHLDVTGPLDVRLVHTDTPVPPADGTT